MTLGMNAFITAQGFAKTGMLSVLIGAVANIILDPIFIFGLHMGVAGRRTGNDSLAGHVLCLGPVVSGGKKTHLRIRVQNMASGKDHCAALPGTRPVQLRHAVQRERDSCLL